MESFSQNERKPSLEPAPISTGFPLGEFSVGDVINFGRMLDNGQQTQVRMCLHNGSKIFFCLKMEPFVDQEHKRVLIEKGNIQKMASHPAIVALYATYSDDFYVYHIMEYLPGGDLFEMVSSVGAIPEKMAKRYTAQLVLAVEFLHSNRILHNDIKLENLLLDNVHTLKLTDFGLATYEFEERPSSIHGTPEYMSPETIVTKRHSKATDWWSVGICIYELLTGNLPFNMRDSDTTIMTFQKILHSRLEVPDTVNPVARDLVSKLLTMDTNARLGSGAHGSQNVKSHEWFADIQWDTVLNEENPGVDFVRNLDALNG